MKNIKDLEEQLKLQGGMLGAVEEWWASQIGLKISEHAYLKEKLINRWDEEGSNRLIQLEKEIDHLQKKSIWEQKEIDKHKEKCQNFEKLQEKIKLHNLTKNLKKINKDFQK